MDEAVREYARHRAGPEEWIVNRFVVPIGRLEELRHAVGALPGGPTSADPWPLTVLGTSPEQFAQDREIIRRFSGEIEGAFLCEGFEVKLNGDSISSRTLGTIAAAGFEDAFLELPWNINQLEVMDQLAEIEVVGAKVRTGGVKPDGVPSPDALASFLQECVNLDLQFKLTAGLHYPIRAHHEEFGGAMHGFLNVIMAGALAEAHDLNRQEISRVLTEEDPEAFTFQPDELGWRDWQVAADEARDFRDLFASIGSCSIDVPVTELRSLGLWSCA